MTPALRILYGVPLVGPTLRDAVGGKSGAIALLATYALLAVAGLVVRFGYPALIVFALAATAICLAGLVVLTAGDFFSRPGRTD
jgi:hypothetical protein